MPFHQIFSRFLPFSTKFIVGFLPFSTKSQSIGLNQPQKVDTQEKLK